jgi:hypothetical protein
MLVRKTPLTDGDGERDQVCVGWILPCWQARHPWAQLVTSLERSHHTNLDEIIQREASLPG